MYQRGILILVLFIAHMAGCFSQDISHQVLVPLSSIAGTGKINISQTVGEPMVEGLYGADYDLTQGFHQPGIDLSRPDPPEGNGVEVYPNPVVDILKIELFGVEETDFEIIIFGLNGTVYYQRNISCARDYWLLETVDLASYKRGMYFVRIKTKDNRISRLFKIEKM